MKISILTLFPEMFKALNCSIIGRAIDNNILSVNVVDIRSFSLDKHSKCDDTPYGGGAGMVMTAQPIFDAFKAIDPLHTMTHIYMSPKGETINSQIVCTLAKDNKDLVILCGHYEGVDERVIQMCIDIEYSIGDYVLTGGELPAMVLIDSLSRFIPNVLGSEDSASEESFYDGLLEYPQYTRPMIFNGVSVPEILISGHHENIKKWRKQQSLALTKKLRPDLLEDKNE